MITVVLVLALVSGMLAGGIAYARTASPSYGIVLFVVGFILPVVGIIGAFVVSRPAPPPLAPGWYTDPWRQAAYRYHDGQQWTYHASNGAAQE